MTTTTPTPGPTPKPAPVDELAPLKEVLYAIGDEVEAQDRQWGPHEHPLIGGRNPAAAKAYYFARTQDWQGITEARERDGSQGCDSILLEEVYEALSAETPEDQIAELTQVAAVCANQILFLKRKLALQ